MMYVNTLGENFFLVGGGGGDKEAFHNLGLSKYIMVIWIFQ